MSIKSKRVAYSTVGHRKIRVKGREYTTWYVNLGKNDVTKKEIYISAKNQDILYAKIDEFYKAREASGDFASYLNAEQILDAKMALEALSKAGVGISLAECARREIERFSALSCASVAIGKAYDEFIATKTEGTADHKKTKSTVGRWVMAVGKDALLDTITTKDIASYVNTMFGGMKPKTYNSNLQYIRTFLNWCVNEAQGYLKKNPAAPIDEKPEEWEEPEYMSAADVRKLFDAASSPSMIRTSPEILADLVLGFFCGIRREERIRMASDPKAISVNIEDETVRVAKPKGYTKGIMPRAFHIHPTALAWMKSFDFQRAVSGICENTSKVISRMADELGVEKPKNAARHTFITMHVAAYGDPAKTQAMVGTSAQMRANNYCGLASRKEGEEFFSILPASRTA